MNNTLSNFNVKNLNQIHKRDLLSLIDKHFESRLVDPTYDVSYVEPSRLITHNRLDLAIKILYLRMRAYKGVSFAEELYVNHINAFTLGSFTEPGNSEKNNIQRYLDDFESMYKSIMFDGFDEKRSLIPLSSGGMICNGAHRVASAYLANKTVPSVILNIPGDRYGYKFFLQRGMANEEADIAVTTFIEFAESCHIALIWPSAKGHQQELSELIPNIVYQREISLNCRGAHNLLSQVYYDESWLGSREKNYPGINNKLIECFKTFDNLRIVAFQAESLEKVLIIKENIRRLFSIGKHSVHITDTKEEAIRIARVLFNENSLHFLNHGDSTKFLSLYKKIDRFKHFIKKNNIETDQVVLDSSIVMSLYGIRECNDIDYLSVNTNIKYHEELIEDHSEVLTFHQKETNTLVMDPSFYFYYDGLKFISFSQLYKMKKNRFEKKDKNDLALMEALIENNLVKAWMSMVNQKVYFFTVKSKVVIANSLKFIGMYEFVRSLYLTVKAIKKRLK